MGQVCIDGKSNPETHEPEIERYYDEERPTEVLRIFRCNKCGMVMEKDIIKKVDDEIVHDGFEKTLGQGVEQTE